MNHIAPRRFSAARIVLLVLLAILAFLLLWPTRVQPVAWQPAPAPSLSQGAFAENQKLKALQAVGARDIDGPEALLLEQDQLISGLHDGRVIQTRLDGSTLKVLVNTGGRPLGLARHPDGRLIIADAIKGLLALDSQGQLQTLSTAANGLAFGFTDDVAVDAAGRYAYFSDASSRWGYGHDGEAVIEHGADGRLLRYDFQSGKTEVLLEGLEFANGVALGPDEAYVLVNETGAYRISRYWLKGDQAGRHDLFIDNLPGLPDNLSFNGAGRFWVALYAPRNPLLDGTAPYPLVRKMLVRAMTVLPKPVEKRGFVLGLDTQGRVIANLQDASSGNYSPITTVREYGDALYLGSLTARHMARLPLQEALAP
ncbi:MULTISPECIES: SMP-30/gluconolactonase/LRE family protein [Pseudomonas]|uniref:SMP-30/gluconolactonase/LRE family protein n=1 Tax=Pseudomonas protegens TaxID=380021 RepID=A0A2T6GGV2_9PSED|nr:MULTISPECIES: SMP-30/gluconolactonase/LRE family protein [Pseudomonas]PUA43385.1 SMP-30/gluconolactonase/LRE family protein [Pseudomonas protegens]ULT73108.1 SMP-30/gluconolactonase/LRE family protein [Pseudomonas sp. BC42]BAQ81699.1 strictosidine synthase [Pseudomonas sp. St29]